MLYSKSAGNGKTHLSIATVKYWLINTWIPKYCDGDMPKTFSVIPEHILFHEIRKTFTENNGVSEIDIIRKHSKADILIMDDIGKYSVADLAFIQRVWFSIIDERCGYKRPTILTTNKTGQQLKHHFGDYTFDRLRGMSGGKITEIIGESKR
jgi:DNA replication protein DnaC